MHIFQECPYVQILSKTFLDLISIFTAEDTDMEMSNIVLYEYSKENQVYTLISTIVNSYVFVCKYADNTSDPLVRSHKIEFYQGTERLIYNKIRSYTNT